MLDYLVTCFAIGLLLFAAIAIVAYLVVRFVFIRMAERVSAEIAARIAGAAPHLRVPQITSPGAAAVLARLDRTARLMDRAITLPLVGGIGLDAILGFVPYVGDAASAIVSGSIILNSLQYGLPRAVVAQMVANMFVDLLFGSIPILGDVFDIFFKANERNLALVRAHLDSVKA